MKSKRFQRTETISGGRSTCSLTTPSIATSKRRRLSQTNSYAPSAMKWPPWWPAMPWHRMATQRRKTKLWWRKHLTGGSLCGRFQAAPCSSATWKRRLWSETRRGGASACTSSISLATHVFPPGLISTVLWRHPSLPFPSPYKLDQSLDNTFILALDGDVEFNYIGVQRLVEVKSSKKKASQFGRRWCKSIQRRVGFAPRCSPRGQRITCRSLCRSLSTWPGIWCSR